MLSPPMDLVNNKFDPRNDFYLLIKVLLPGPLRARAEEREPAAAEEGVEVALLTSEVTP